MFLSYWLLSKENIIVAKDCIQEDNKRVGEKDQDGEEDVKKFPVAVVILPVEFKSTDFSPEVILIVGVTYKHLVVVP